MTTALDTLLRKVGLQPTEHANRTQWDYPAGWFDNARLKDERKPVVGALHDYFERAGWVPDSRSDDAFSKGGEKVSMHDSGITVFYGTGEVASARTDRIIHQATLDLAGKTVDLDGTPAPMDEPTKKKLLEAVHAVVNTPPGFKTYIMEPDLKVVNGQVVVPLRLISIDSNMLFKLSQLAIKKKVKFSVAKQTTGNTGRLAMTFTLLPPKK